MAIVLIIFGLVLASASSILTLFVNKGGAERTRRMMEADKNVLFSIAASDGYFLNASDTARDENSELTAKLTYPADSYGKTFHLITDETLDYPAAKSSLYYKPICGTDATKTTLTICGNAACDSGNTTVSDVAFVLISGSANKNIQTEAATNVVNVYPQGADGIDDYTADMDRAEKYDDIVDWVTLPELRTKAGCDPEKLSLLDSTMPAIQNAHQYDFNIYAKGGVPYRQSAASPTVPEYTFALNDDGGLPADILFYVKGESSDTELTEGGGAVQGEYLIITGNSTAIGTTPYLVKITVGDDSASVSGGSGNHTDRTLYIEPQN